MELLKTWLRIELSRKVGLTKVTLNRCDKASMNDDGDNDLTKKYMGHIWKISFMSMVETNK